MATAFQIEARRSDQPLAGMFRVLGVRINAVQIPDVIARMEQWLSSRESPRYIAVTGMHGVTEALDDLEFKQVLNEAALVVPDGYPIAWLGRRKGHKTVKRRVYGPELMARFCKGTASKGYRHFFYGGAPGVAEELQRQFVERYPGLIVAGTCCPPFRPVTLEEDQEIIARIEAAKPDIVWVGLSTPKQERWMFNHRTTLTVPILVGVGAAFDFHAGMLPQAPSWMQEHGLEWLFRLSKEPRRLWRRYLVYGSKFVFFVVLESLGVKKF